MGQKLMETMGYWDIAEPHGTKETTVTLRKLMEASSHCRTKESTVDNTKAPGTERPLFYSEASWNQGAMVTLWGLMNQIVVVTQRGCLQPIVHRDTADPRDRADTMAVHGTERLL